MKTEQTCTAHENLVSETRRLARLLAPARATAIRKGAGISQQRLAAELGVHRVTVARWETGVWRPRGAMRQRYADLLAALDREVRSRVREGKTRLRALRETRGWTLARAGRLTVIQPSRLSAIERRLAVPSQLEVTRLCQILDWPLDRAGELIIDEVDDGA
jgi:transcriptional regulator with XRE-family HTH domain